MVATAPTAAAAAAAASAVDAKHGAVALAALALRPFVRTHLRAPTNVLPGWRRCRAGAQSGAPRAATIVASGRLPAVWAHLRASARAAVAEPHAVSARRCLGRQATTTHSFQHAVAGVRNAEKNKAVSKIQAKKSRRTQRREEKGSVSHGSYTSSGGSAGVRHALALLCWGTGSGTGTL